MLSYLYPELLNVVHACPLLSVAVGRDRYSVGYSPPGQVGVSVVDRPSVAARGTLPPVDWTIYIPSAVTGVVGLTGIGGALWQAKRAREAAAEDAKANREAASSDLQASMRQTTSNLVVSINAEDKRADIATKRRIYAECLAASQHRVEVYSCCHNNCQLLVRVFNVPEVFLSTC